MRNVTQTVQRASWRAAAGALAIGCALAGQVSAGAPGAPPSYGHDFVTVGAPGNRAALESERYYGSALAGFPNLGQVNQSFRISRTEITVSGWHAFVEVAWPHQEALGYPRGAPAFTGSYIQPANLNPSQPPNFVYQPAVAQIANTMSFRFAAWYCNWLHNGRPTDPGAITMETFTTGAYDNATLTRQSGALYWVPNLDEWTKATYYDPNRYGPGQDGYWLHPGMSMVPLVGGPPGTPGAQTSAGSWHQGQGLPPDVGSYPHVQSPWGLLDTSGGVSEWTETPFQGLNQRRHYRGEALGGGEDKFFDINDYFFLARGVDGSNLGFRIASSVPSGSALALCGTCLACVAGRRRRTMI